MKMCPNCKNYVDDNATFCNICGNTFPVYQQVNQQPINQNFNNQANYNMAYDQFDHTHEFDPQDISDNKVIAMLVYLLGVVGIIVALVSNNGSKYVDFHLRQALKFVVVNTLMAIISGLLFWTLIVPFAYAIMLIVLFIIKIICFFQICSGKAKEPAIIRNLKFLR